MSDEIGHLVVSVDHIRGRLEIIREIACERHDNEVAHGLEDCLLRDVLRAIAAGHAKDPAACAAEVLKTYDHNWGRWMA